MTRSPETGDVQPTPAESRDADRNRPERAENGRGAESPVPPPMRNDTQVFIAGAIEPDQPVVDRAEVTELGGGGMSERLTLQVRYANCGHMTRTADQIGGVCQCCRTTAPYVFCTECASREENLCGLCRNLTCGDCQRRLWLAPHLGTVCRRCYWRWWLKEGLIAVGAAIMIAVALALVLRFL